MPNSTRTLQNVVDYAKTIGDLMPAMPAGGYTNFLAYNIANDVMSDICSQRFNWKWNRIVVPPFYTISWQQDYAAINIANIGWLEHAVIVDINNTIMPKPIFWLECVRDLERTSFQFGSPRQIAWLPNDQMVQGTWPGANTTFVNPLGAISTPSNKLINILDAHGNILILTTYGTTGGVAPDAGATPLIGATVNDGSCVWTVANPKGQGFRVSPLPPQTGVVYQVYVIAQAKPTQFTAMNQLLDPIPDDFAKFFNEGFITYSHRHATAPVVRDRFPRMKEMWLGSLAEARGQGDREKDAAGFVPATSIMQESFAMPIGPAWPYGPGI
jgi:hypothetical protein